MSRGTFLLAPFTGIISITFFLGIGFGECVLSQSPNPTADQERERGDRIATEYANRVWPGEQARAICHVERWGHHDTYVTCRVIHGPHTDNIICGLDGTGCREPSP